MGKRQWLAAAAAMTMACAGGGCSSAPPKTSTGADPVSTGDGPKNSPPAASQAAHEHDEVPTASKPTDEHKAQPPVAADGAVVPLENLLPSDPTTAKDFPKATVSDKECTRSVGLTGQLDKDFEALAASCGAGTGMKEYARRVSGSVSNTHKRDTYLFKMTGGYCYRFFAVADGSVEKMGIRVQRPDGALVSLVQGKQPVVVLDPNEPWCKQHDRDFHLVVESSGGQGRYTFGVWARLNPKGRAK